MKIRRMVIGSFGKFKNKIIDFNDGLNIITGKNEAGKSTLAAYITIMLYGCENSAQRGGLGERKKYLPWDSETILGEMYIESDEMEYIIIRKFGKTSKGDTLSVINKVTGMAMDIGNSTPGEHFLHMGRDAFEKTVFIRQLSVRLAKGRDDEVFEKIMNLSHSGEENLSYQKALGHLTEKKRQIDSRQRKESKLNIIDEKLDQLEDERSKAMSYKLRCERGEEENKLLQKKIEETKSELEKWKEERQKSILAKNNEEIFKKYNYVKQISDEAKSIQDEIDLHEKHENLEKKKAKETKKSEKIFVFFLIFSLLFILGGLLLFIDYKIIGVVLAFAGAGVFAFGFVFKSRARKKRDVLEKEIEIINALGYELNNKQAILNGVLGDVSIQDLENSAKDFDRSKTALPLQSIDERIAALSDLILNCERKISANEALNAEGLETFKDPAEIEEEISSLSEQKEFWSKKATALEMARTEIENAFLKMQQEFGPKLNQYCNEVLDTITKGKYVDFRVSHTYDISLSEADASMVRESTYLSAGTVDQIYFALRMGIIKLLSFMSLPLFLDDSFIQYDNERLEAALEYIYAYSKHSQVLLFSCHDRERNMLKHENINLIAL